ncbi:hypothetical protein [Micromonospora craniellae]|uniref:Uncharacterized protein n=1 Tax=Micromonospora craniellae TaxID=2294034 RepID=A0A372FSA2_9ACTN|nr:hypothetical protein [Micromonospora craniellae]QOC93475.1 hypothetical protein ID554_07365 [Micromonospora craniellae]RFS43466.1 hypothetical protein D0Q02_27680 [Micromonospora craniellae]
MPPLVMHLRSLDGHDVAGDVDLEALNKAAAARLWNIVPLLHAQADPVGPILNTYVEARDEGRLGNVSGIAVHTDRPCDLATPHAPIYVYVTGPAATPGALLAARRRYGLVMVDDSDTDLANLDGPIDGLAPLLVRHTGTVPVDGFAAAARDSALTLCVDLTGPPARWLPVIRLAGPERVVGLAEQPEGTLGLSAGGDLPALGGWELPAGNGVTAAITRLRLAGFTEDDIEEVLCGTAERAMAETTPQAIRSTA